MDKTKHCLHNRVAIHSYLTISWNTIKNKQFGQTVTNDILRHEQYSEKNVAVGWSTYIRMNDIWHQTDDLNVKVKCPTSIVTCAL